jgi:hypothetical protein
MRSPAKCLYPHRSTRSIGNVQEVHPVRRLLALIAAIGSLTAFVSRPPLRPLARHP